MNRDLLQLLIQELQWVEEAAKVLKLSEEKCLALGSQASYTADELEKFEALTSRFARLCDLLLQKIFRLIDEIELESPGTLRDRIYRAEKKGLIDQASQFIECRILRNEIAHEYTPTNVLAIFKRVLEMTPALLASVARVKTYCEKYNNLP